MEGEGERSEKETRRAAPLGRGWAGRPADDLRPTVLIVDDEDAIRDFLRSALEAEGYNVLAAGDGLDALALCERYQVHVILLDLNMPRLDGRGFLARMRQHQGLEGVSVYIMSAVLSAVEHAISQGVAGGFAKPFDLDELIETLADAVTRSPETPGPSTPPGVRPAPSPAPSPIAPRP
jgi:two-component system, chemotaxis family, chemotaxis protein CheY